jgi:hypothetical protein
MNKEFIPYEQALELKELGFNEHCIAYYTIFQDKLIFSYTAIYDSGNEYIDLVTNDNPSNSKEFATAPLYQQAFRWFREKYKLYSYIESRGVGYVHYVMIENVQYSEHKTYEEAELACLKKLIEIAKNK